MRWAKQVSGVAWDLFIGKNRAASVEYNPSKEVWFAFLQPGYINLGRYKHVRSAKRRVMQMVPWWRRSKVRKMAGDITLSGK